MAEEAIKKVTELEQDAKRRKEAAVAEAKQQVLVAQRAGQRLLEDTHQAAETEVKQMMADAEEQAAQWTEQVLAAAGQECEQMKARARTRLDQAAARIVERVVNR